MRLALQASAAIAREVEPQDLYKTYKMLKRQLEFIQVQEEYIKDEQANLKMELVRAQVRAAHARHAPQR